jgi:hypothetical protein
MVLHYRRGDLSQQEYTALYWQLLEERRLTVKEWLDSLSPEVDITLLCFEPKDRFCHRHLVAELVRRERPDIPVNEL